MTKEPDFIKRDFTTYGSISKGEICIYGNCYPANFFTEEQWDAVHELAANVITNSEFYHKKEIKLLRSKHRKAVRKLKDKLNQKEEQQTIMS
jgi:hypothetical protein